MDYFKFINKTPPFIVCVFVKCWRKIACDLSAKISYMASQLGSLWPKGRKPVAYEESTVLIAERT